MFLLSLPESEKTRGAVRDRDERWGKGRGRKSKEDGYRTRGGGGWRERERGGKAEGRRRWAVGVRRGEELLREGERGKGL